MYVRSEFGERWEPNLALLLVEAFTSILSWSRSSTWLNVYELPHLLLNY